MRYYEVEDADFWRHIDHADMRWHQRRHWIVYHGDASTHTANGHWWITGLVIARRWRRAAKRKQSY